MKNPDQMSGPELDREIAVLQAEIHKHELKAAVGVILERDRALQAIDAAPNLGAAMVAAWVTRQPDHVEPAPDQFGRPRGFGHTQPYVRPPDLADLARIVRGRLEADDPEAAAMTLGSAVSDAWLNRPVTPDPFGRPRGFKPIAKK